MTITTNNESYPKLGNDSAIPLADMEDMQASVNINGDTRLGRKGMGKHAGKKVLVNTGTTSTDRTGNTYGTSTYQEYMALGALASDPWQPLGTTGASSLVTPTNISDPSNAASGWTIATH